MNNDHTFKKNPELERIISLVEPEAARRAANSAFYIETRIRQALAEKAAARAKNNKAKS